MSAGDLDEPMMDGPELTGDDLQAAEYAMGLLEGEALLAARGRMAREPGFAGLVGEWEARLGPLMDEVGVAAPHDDLWGRIASELAGRGDAPGEVVTLQRRIAMWQRIAAGSAVAAVAAIALLFVPTDTTPVAPPVAAQAPLVASIPIADTPLRVGLTFLPESDELLVAADGLTADGVHDHELWLVPPGEGAQVQSLGLVTPGTQKRVSLDPELAGDMQQGAQILISQEPIGGAPDKSAPGPVVAEGVLVKT